MSKENKILTPKKETVLNRINQVLLEQKRTKSWLAEQVGISKQMLNYQLKSAEKIKCLNDISYALSLNPTWLKYGEKPKYILPDDRAPFRLIAYLDWPNLIDEYFLSMINRKAKSPYSDLVVS